MPIPRDYKLEACVESYDQAIRAFQAGADRIEICSKLETEGMTPGYDLVEKLLGEINIPVRVMIRETEAGFDIDPMVFEKMKSSIEKFKQLQIDGFVIGVLKNGRLDKVMMEKLFDVCNPYSCTVHKAIDSSEQMMEDARWLNGFENVDTILTSGGKRTVMEGMEEILKMKEVFGKDIMAGGKVVKGNVEELHERLGLRWYHGRAIV